MFTRINIGNFKLYKDTVSFDNLRSVNILTGVNGRGKSTFLQVLLLMKQTILQNNRNSFLLLNGDYIQLGNAFDVKNINVSRKDSVSLEFYIKDYSVHYLFHVDENERNLKIFTCFLSDDKGNILSPMFIEKENEHPLINLLPYAKGMPAFNFDRIQYISAERIGPKLYYSLHDKGIIGAKGEYAVCQFHLHKSDVLPDKYFDELENIFYNINTEEVDKTIGGQAEFWLSKMFARTTIDTKYVEEANVVTLKISTVQNGTNRMKPTNVGFGYTYVFPILVAGLISKPGDTLIIENPEAHLHPAAQSIIGKFLALISQMGVQVFIETHSEHILNSFRVLIAQEAFDKDDINIMFFDEGTENYYTPIEVNEKGKITNWPLYFFDQSERDLNIILGE